MFEIGDHVIIRNPTGGVRPDDRFMVVRDKGAARALPIDSFVWVWFLGDADRAPDREWTCQSQSRVMGFDESSLLKIEPDAAHPGVSHIEADRIAQRTLGNLDPAPGEGPDEYSLRMDEARNSFQKHYPRWGTEEGIG